MSRRRSRRRKLAETVLDIAVGGPALAADKVAEAVDEIVERGEEAVNRGRRATRRPASRAAKTARKTAKTARRKVVGKGARSYEERTRGELYQLAADRGIEGRSSMRKAELIAALREER